MYEIQTSNFIKPVKVNMDGKSWIMTPPGAGDELMINQGQRRAKRLEKKITDGTATDEDYDLYDKIENKMFTSFSKMFRDQTEDNREVKVWLETTPMAVVYAIIEDIKAQSDKNNEEKAEDGATEQIS